MRIATWNLERPRTGSVRKLAGLLERIASIPADLWVLTETNDAVDLTASHPYRVATDPVERLHTPGERWTTIWSRFPIAPVATYDATIAACADVDAPAGPLLIYGTVLPYHADGGDTGQAAAWSEFYRVTPLQGADWCRLRAAYPERRLVVAGDLNQSRDGRRWDGRQWYGTAKGRALLDAALTEAGLVSVTDEDFVESGKLTTRSSIDHVCVDRAWAARGVVTEAWEAGLVDGTRLSDHNGVLVQLVV